jgi:hypothetical protein
MKRDWLVSSRPQGLLQRLKRIAVGSAAVGVGLFGTAATASTPPSSVSPTDVQLTAPATIVDRSKKTAKLVLQLPGTVRNLIAQHVSHSSHSSHVSGTSGSATAPSTTPAPSASSSTATPATSSGDVAVNASANAEQTTGKYFAFDPKQKILIVQDGVGTKVDFVLRGDSTLAVAGASTRVDAYLPSHANSLPYSANQQLRISWKPSLDGKQRVVVGIQ